MRRGLELSPCCYAANEALALVNNNENTSGKWRTAAEVGRTAAREPARRDCRSLQIVADSARAAFRAGRRRSGGRRRGPRTGWPQAEIASASCRHLSSVDQIVRPLYRRRTDGVVGRADVCSNGISCGPARKPRPLTIMPRDPVRTRDVPDLPQASNATVEGDVVTKSADRRRQHAGGSAAAS